MAVRPLRRCLCTGFSSPLVPFNLLFGKTTQCSSPLYVSISSYLNLLQSLLKATGGLGKRPGSACALAAWSCCCRYLIQQGAQDLQPHSAPERGQALCLYRAGQGSAGPSVTTDRARTALKVGERNQLQKTSPVFPPGSSKSGWQTKANVVTSKSC